MDFLATRSAEQLDRLYTSPAAVLATFRQLPKLSQMFFMKAIWLRDSSKQRYIYIGTESVLFFASVEI